MTNRITAELNGIACYSAHVSHRAGTAPSTARVMLPLTDAERIRKTRATLRLSDGRTTLTIRSLIVRSVSMGDEYATVLLSDRRADWRSSAPDINSLDSLNQAVRVLLGSLDEGASLARLKRGSDTPIAINTSGLNAAQVLERLLIAHGQTLVLDPQDRLRAIELAPGLPRRASFISKQSDALEAPGAIEVLGGPLLRDATLESSWQQACMDENGELQPLADLLTDWSVAANDLAAAALIPDGIAQIVSAPTPEEEAQRIALLTQHAWRTWRWDGDEQFIAARASESGELTPPLLQHDGYRAQDRNVANLVDPYASPASPERVNIGFAIDGLSKTLHFAQPTGVLNAVTPPVHDTRLEGRTLDAAPTLQLKVAQVVSAASPLLKLRTRSRSEGTLRIQRGELLGLQDENGNNSRPDNLDELRSSARVIARAVKRALPAKFAEAEMAGVYDLYPQLAGEVIWRADQRGLITQVKASADAFARIAEAFTTRAPELPMRFDAGANEQLPRTHINAYTKGPLILRTSGNADESESYVAAEADDINASTNALSLDKLAPLRTPFHVAHTNSDQAGGWFFAAPVRKTASGFALLDDASNENADFAAITADALNGGELPEGCDGLLVQGMDGATQLVLFDRPLIAQHRGNSLTDYSVEVRDVDGDELDAIKRGGLHFSLMVCLSPEHLAQGVGGTASNPGWVPALNLKDLNSGTPEDFMRAGRGLFAETGGLNLGRLAHLPLQGGPIMADSQTCTKHRYGTASSPDGTYIETAGHIATDAFFKVRGSEHFDGPIAFTEADANALVPSGTRYRAQIMFNPGLPHTWNNSAPMGKWIIVYTMPFTDLDTPPDWQPEEDHVATWSKNQAGPSFDWAPPPSTGAPEEAIAFPGITVKAVGYAPETDDVPDASEGGGLFFIPGELDLKSGAPWAHSGPDRSVVLHPSLGLAFGLPSLDGDGAPHSGAVLHLDSNGELCIKPVDASGDTDSSKGISVKGSISADGVASVAALELTSAESNPGETPASTLWQESESGALSFGDQVVLTRNASGAPEVTGSRAGNAALASLLSALDGLGVIQDSTVA